MARNKERYMAHDRSAAELDQSAPSEFAQQAALVKSGESIAKQIDMTKHVPSRLYHEGAIDRAKILADIEKIVGNQIERYKSQSALSTFTLRETSALKNLVGTYVVLQDAAKGLLDELGIDNQDASVIVDVWHRNYTHEEDT